MTRRMGFQDIKTEVLSRIRSRIWDQGDLLPNEESLAREFGCARATVNRALRELASEGIIDRKRKSGSRVAKAPVRQAKLVIPVVRQTIENMNAGYRYALVDRQISRTPDWLMARLAPGCGQDVLHLRCMHYADARPFQFEDRWINIAAVPQVTGVDFTETGPNEWLLAEMPFTQADIAFSAEAATDHTAEFLDTPPGTPLFQMERITWNADQAVTFVRMTFHPGYRMQSAY